MVVYTKTALGNPGNYLGRYLDVYVNPNRVGVDAITIIFVTTSGEVESQPAKNTLIRY